MEAYTVSYMRYDGEFPSTNLVWAGSYEVVSAEFDGCYWFAAEKAAEWKIKECRAKGMPERWL